MDITPETEDSSAVPFHRRILLWLRGRPVMMRIVLALAALAIIPYALIVLYLIPFIHPVSTLMLRDLVLLRGYDRQWVSIDKISPVLVQSVMMSEDGQYCFHGGVDWAEMRMLVSDTLAGHSTRGGSTIPMQTAKNLFLWNSRSFVRKALELPLAVTADFVWSKRRLMEIYLNIAEWGPGIYGIEAAARHHFKVPASKLSSRQAALLAVSLPNPIDRNAGKPGRGLRRLAAVIERRARSSGEYVRCIYD
ncbi:monofunctional biosynthetic peptidoglycan transglycosylase [Rhizobium sp. Root708]|uniref:monofunctional biosynthetic peptidoglycan transglycosylase n=1 Tax=Rhizobium sp. Root708 TaxID=1736592 RepID=UPI0006FDFBFC|nr:monofunctional biosynthetic peptidoglycan transglycosylase [Rhizobium sp. Root708]KRB62853.1 monofunctional biosynthetic peptidoglycan transglycosylase [Rhizobium sp. Root708]